MRSSTFQDRAGSTQTIYKNLALVMPPGSFTRYRLKDLRIVAGSDINDPAVIDAIEKSLAMPREQRLFSNWYK